MSKKAIHTELAPAAIGPYSQAIQSGDLLFCSGQIGLDPSTGEVVAGGAVEQAKQVVQNLANVLEAAGSSWADVVKTTVYLKDFDHFEAVNAIYSERLGEIAPARATVEVSRLPKDVLVEIDAIARLMPNVEKSS